jgi:DNA polymerase I-like protein with 3'-5' exonuclease and polymerase domains
VVKRELKRELAKDEQVSDWGAAALTREQLEYAARDAAVLPELAATLMRKIKRADLKKVYELERRVSYAVDAMQRYGVAIHTDRLDEMTEEATERAERLKAELAAEWGINPGSSKQLREHFKLDGRKDWPKTEGGSPSTNQEAMKGLLAEEESVAKWLEWKEVEKIRSTYGESLRKRLTPEGRIHARFHPFGTATGRFSSSSPNLQNMWRAPAGADSPVLAAFLRAKLNFSKLLGVREAPEACWPGYPREVNGHQARALSDGMQIRAYLFYAAGRLWRVGALKLSVSAHVLLGD